jgi:transcriptional regulator with XRE-family HTH domain
VLPFGELGEFLRSRRARLSPSEAGLPVREGSRRVAGLRREELAFLAGVSVDYYSRLEQGRAANVSDEVLNAVADALRLDPFERRHLLDLAEQPGQAPRPPAGQPEQALPALRMMVDALDPVPALLHDPCLDVVAINRMGKVLIDDFDAMPAGERNLARWMFLNPRAQIAYPDWAQIAVKMVAIVRGAAGHGRCRADLAELIADVAGRSEAFTQYWNDYQIYRPTNGTKRFFHEAVGIMTINHESLIPAVDPSLSLLVYTAAVGSRSEEKLKALSRWPARDEATPSGPGTGLPGRLP